MLTWTGLSADEYMRINWLRCDQNMTWTSLIWQTLSALVWLVQVHPLTTLRFRWSHCCNSTVWVRRFPSGRPWWWMICHKTRITPHWHQNTWIRDRFWPRRNIVTCFAGNRRHPRLPFFRTEKLLHRLKLTRKHRVSDQLGFWITVTWAQDGSWSRSCRIGHKTRWPFCPTEDLLELLKPTSGFGSWLGFWNTVTCWQDGNTVICWQDGSWLGFWPTTTCRRDSRLSRLLTNSPLSGELALGFWNRTLGWRDRSMWRFRGLGTVG